MEQLWTSLLDNLVTGLRAIVVLLPVFVIGAGSSLVFSFFYYRIVGGRLLRSLMIFLTFSSFGSTIGMFMGASSQPIVASVLPPVITLTSGYLVFLKSASFPLRTRVLIPGALVLMLGMLQFAAWYMKFWLNPLTS
jgi:hypothetical protein